MQSPGLKQIPPNTNHAMENACDLDQMTLALKVDPDIMVTYLHTKIKIKLLKIGPYGIELI